jgi:hypothetical protein
LADERIREFCDGGVPEVAEALGIAGTTVKTHLGSVYKKNGGLGSGRHERLSEISSLRNVRYHPRSGAQADIPGTSHLCIANPADLILVSRA